ncbi:POZ domain-containing protein [Trametes versicolor FP-101664 SS1]|uniref:POZ domain-containing protein n=1 Tax=Trametes versicolor (strain FP-101664) TaxID=717944 RepID=UPI0004622F95|nr:POZ domain-containing protein [Trametes versicolor FP-101664 SS1]EIW56079.1 POZ domain-containing protein [Trametes versicolor FP-101664 SS1]
MLFHHQAGDNDKVNEWVRLTSTDGYEFLVKRKVAACSGTLRNSLSAESHFSEALSNTAHTNERAVIVEKLCEYLSYKSLYESAKKNEEIPDFQERVYPEISLELLVAADYYDGLCRTSRFIVSQLTASAQRDTPLPVSVDPLAPLSHCSVTHFT